MMAAQHPPIAAPPTPDAARPRRPAPTPRPRPPTLPSIEDRYRFRALEVGGGGWVTGMEIHDSGLTVVRTDVGGAFRYDPATARWQQMLILGNVEDPEPGDYQVESIAIAPSDPDRLVPGRRRHRRGPHRTGAALGRRRRDLDRERAVVSDRRQHRVADRR